MHTYTVHIPTQSDLLAGDTLKNEQGFEIFFIYVWHTTQLQANISECQKFSAC